MSDNKLQNLVSKKFVPVCAIGASAGGITALQGLLRQLPSDLGLAYVVIIHLSPDQPSALSEILSVCTRMPVLQVQDGPILKPDCVYVIPPDRELVIDGDSVTARAFSEPRWHRAPIDMFFRSIAAARGDGLAVVLSGAGADGAEGVRAVKEAGGVIMVQEPAEADFPSMPQNAIASGVADFVAPLARLAERIVEVAHSKEAVRSLDMDGSANDLRRIMAFLRARTGHDFSGYKRATVMRRVIRRMQVRGTDTLVGYADYLLTTPEETKELLSDLLISVTSFFRDQHAYEALERHGVKRLFDDRNPEREDAIRAWVVGCATGEEAYSLAMLLHEEAARRKLHPQVQIFATDLDDGALATAREARYPRSIEANVSEERLARFFVDEGTHYRIRKELRECVLFASHSVIKEPPFLRLDLISCRNLLIYLERSLQQQLCSIFHYGLKPGRFLFLGSAETADVAPDLFAPLDREARIYCARTHAARALPVMPQFTTPEQLAVPVHSLPAPGERADLPGALHVSALEQSAPASALVDDRHTIVHLSPNAGRFILHSVGPVSNLLPGVVRPELRLDLRLALTRAIEQKEPTLTHPAVVAFDGFRRRVAMHVVPVLSEANIGARALVFFLEGEAVPDVEEPGTTPDTRSDEVRSLHAELKAAQEALNASRSGHDTAVQDLRATNEELQSINEEYRSTAEELETSKEELQSINEELHTVNAELKSKLASISIAHSDLQNLTGATEIGTLFLDADLRIRMFTPPIAELFNITKADVGRTITDFTHRLEYDGIEEDARQVLKSLTPVETEVRSKGGQWYVVRLRPYRTVDDRIDGTVVSFVDITARRQAAAALRESEEQYRVLFDSIDEGFCTIEMLFDAQGKASDYRFLHVNAAFERQTGLARVIGTTVRDMVPAHEEHWFEMFGGVALTGEPVRFDNRADSLGRWFDVYAFRIGKPEERRLAVLFRDVLERKNLEAAQRGSEARFRALATAGSYLIYRMSPDWRLMHELNGRNVLADTSEPVQGWADIYILSEDRPIVFAAITEAIRSKSLFELEHRVRLADGSVGWVLSRAVPILGENGGIVEWFGAASDITRRKDAEEKARQSEELRRIALEGGGMGAWRWDLRERLIWGDPRFLDLWGHSLSNEPHPLQLFTDRMSPDGATEMETIVTNAIEAQEEFDGELEIISGPTAGRWVRWRGRADRENPWILHGVSFDTTERRRTATALRESEERLALAFRTLPLGIAIVDATGETVTANDEMHRFLPTNRIPSRDPGRSGRWQCWKSDGQIVQPDDFPAARALRGEGVFPGMQMLYHDDTGAEIWTEVLSAPLRNAESLIAGAITVVIDIDRLKRSEAAAQASEERLRQFGEASLDVLWIRDADTLQWIYLTPAFETIYGLSREEALTGDNYRNWQDLIVPDDRAHATASISRVTDGERITFEYRIRRPVDGQTRWLRNTDFPMRDAAGRVTRIGGVGHDVTELKRVEAALRDSEDRLRTLIEGVPQLIWRSCADGRWTWASPQWLDYTGQTQEESHGLGWRDVVHPDDHEATQRSWQEARPHGRLSVEYRVRRASDGAWRWHQTRSVPVRDAPGSDGTEGPILEWLGTTTDIEDLKRLQGQQQVLVAELQHRTRNLLAVVRNVARRSIDPSPGRDQYDERLSALGRVQGFLSRSPAYSVPLAEVVEAELVAAGDGTSDRVVVDGPAVELPGESVQAVALALHELATNAVKYGAIAQPTGRLSVTWRLEDRNGGRQLVIDWHESGVAMPEGPPTRHGYGSELITQALPYQLGAETALQFTPDGVRCRVVLPDNAFTASLKEELT